MSIPRAESLRQRWRQAPEWEIASALAELQDFEPDAQAAILDAARTRQIEPDPTASATTPPTWAWLRTLLRGVHRWMHDHPFYGSVLFGATSWTVFYFTGPINTGIHWIVNTVIHLTVLTGSHALLYYPIRSYRRALILSFGLALGQAALSMIMILIHAIRESPVAVLVFMFSLHRYFLYFLVFTTVYMLCLSLVVFATNRYRPVFPAGHCRQCGYNLHGLPEPRCPECGRTFEDHDNPTASPDTSP